MPIPNSQRAIDAISQVYSDLGRPPDSELPPSTVCEQFWRQLGKTTLQIKLSDRTMYLNYTLFPVAQSQIAYTIGEIDGFSAELGLEIYDSSTGTEQIQPIPIITDVREKDRMDELVAMITRDATNPSNIGIRFNRPLTATRTFRLWFEPSEFPRPKLGEVTPIPHEGWQYTVVNTSFVCLRYVVKFLGVSFAEFKESVAAEKLEFSQLWKTWLLKPPSLGLNHRIAYNERRRLLGMYGSLPSNGWSRGGPVVLDP